MSDECLCPQCSSQDDTLGFVCPSTESSRLETPGRILTKVLSRAWASPFTTKSDFAREHADFVAMAASDGFITTRQATGLYSNVWLITAKGLRHLETLGGFSES